MIGFECTVGVENIDETVPGSCDVVVLRLVLHRICHVQSSSDPLNVERRETRWQAAVCERPRQTYGCKVLIEDVNCSGLEVGCIEHRAIVSIGHGETFVNRA